MVTCDSIKKKKLSDAMIEFEISVELINLTKATLSKVRCKNKIQAFQFSIRKVYYRQMITPKGHFVE